MRRVYSHQNIAMVGAMRSYLVENNIAAELRNEFSSSVMGEVPFFDVWPELWVSGDDYHCAEQLLAKIQQHTTTEANWCCQNCQQENPANFEICWQCETAI